MSATIVSFLPYRICEKKPGVIPDEYIVPKSDGKTPSILVVKDATTILYRGYEQPNFTIPVPAEKLAYDIIHAFVSSQLAYSDDCKPAVFWVSGSYTAKEVVEKFPQAISDAKTMQNRWFLRLVQMADDDWSKYKQHKMITDIQKLAARSLGLNGKEWLVMPDPIPLVKCPACGSLIENNVIKCRFCGAILDKDRARELGLLPELVPNPAPNTNTVSK